MSKKTKTILLVMFNTLVAVLGSSAAVCSSRSNSLGGTIVAIHNVKACLCPPDNKPTSCSQATFPRLLNKCKYC